MRDFFGSISKAIVIVFLSFVFLTSLGYYSLRMAGYFQPKFEQVRRNVFMESQAYNDGMMRDLQNFQFEYAKADDAGKAIIRSAVQHRFATYDPDRLPADLRSFLYQIKAGN